MADSKNSAVNGSASKETQLDRAQAWVVDQAAITVLKLGRCPIDTIADHIGITSDSLLAVVQSSDRLSVIDGDLDLTICTDNVARSLDRWCSDVIKSVGSSVNIGELAELLTVHLGKSSQAIASSIRASIGSSRSGLTLVGDQIILNEWLPMLGHDDQEDILLENGVKSELLAALLAKAGKGPFTNIQEFALALLKAIQNKPIRHKTLSVAYWALTKGHDSARDLACLMADKRLLWHSGNKGGRWVLSSVETDYRLLVSELIPEPDGPVSLDESVSLETNSDVSEPDLKILIDNDIVEKIRTDLSINRQIIAVSDYGIPVDYLPDYIGLIEAFDGVTSVGFNRYALTNSIPAVDIERLIAYFACPKVEFISEDGEQVEDLVPRDSYAGTLKTDTVHPNNQDVLDDGTTYTGTEVGPSCSFPLYKDHLSHGIIPLCRLNPTLVPWNVEYAPVTICIDDTEYSCSVVNRDGVRCVVGLENAFSSEVAQGDCVATVRQTEVVGRLTLELAPLVDGEYALTDERCKELDVYKETEADNPTVVILTQILDDHPKGITFERALRELRYIRRTSVHKLASILTTNDCFAQKPGTGVWRYNPKRADAGNDIARRTYLKSGF